MITGMKSTRIRDLLKMIREMFHENIDIHYSDEHMSGHYNMTPYIFKPIVAKKYILNYYHDLGQGILEHIYETYEDLNRRGLVNHIQELAK